LGRLYYELLTGNACACVPPPPLSTAHPTHDPFGLRKYLNQQTKPGWHFFNPYASYFEAAAEAEQQAHEANMAYALAHYDLFEYTRTWLKLHLSPQDPAAASFLTRVLTSRAACPSIDEMWRHPFITRE
jgi:hypothetical protein